MKRTLTYAWRTLSLGITAYALVHTRDVPKAYADTIVDTDCSTDLNQPNTTYRLIANATTSCIIAADNIILDGQNLYSITGNVIATTTISGGLTVRNVTSISGNVEPRSQNLVNHFDIENTTIGGAVSLFTDPSATSHITNTTISWLVGLYGPTAPGALVIDNSTIGYGIYNVNNVTITNSTLGSHILPPYGSSMQSVTLINSTLDGYGTAPSIGTSTSCTITDSTITNPAVVSCGTLTLTDTPPTLTVTPLTLSLEQGDPFNPFTGVTATDTKDGSLTGDVSVIGSVGTEPGTYPLVYSVTDHGTTLFNTYDHATTTVGPSTASTTRTVTRTGTVSVPTETESETESSSHATWVGHRSSGGGPTHTTDTSSTTATTTPSSESLDATLAELRTVLAQPITTTDTTTLTKLVDLLTQLLAVLAQLIAKGR